MSNQELTTIDDAEIVGHSRRRGSGSLVMRDEDGGLTVEGMVERRRKIKRVIEEVMEPDVHYGRIPGCGPKPALFKGGAEVLCQTFGLAPKYSEVIIDLGGNHREVRVRCSIVHVASGATVAEGLGSCATVERKYRKTEPADVYNTVLKMAAKRAMVAGVIAATGTSDVLTQDLEDEEHQEQPRRDNRMTHQAPPSEAKSALPTQPEPPEMKSIADATTEIELAGLVPALTKLNDYWRPRARKKYGDRLVAIRKESESADATKRQQIQIVRDDDVPPPTQEHVS